LLDLIFFPLFSYLMLFFFNDTPTTDLYTLSLHDALPISSSANLCTTFTSSRRRSSLSGGSGMRIKLPSLEGVSPRSDARIASRLDRKSTRLNSSHVSISYAVFCLKKKKNKIHQLMHLLFD